LSLNDQSYAQTRRHWWELVREAIDLCFRCWVICSVTAIAYHYTGWRRVGWLLLLMILPVGPFMVELIRWNTTIYTLEVRDGGNYFRKTNVNFNFKNAGELFVEEGRQTGIKGELIETKARNFEKWIGYKRVTMNAGGQKAFDGDRVPEWFIQALDSRAPPKKLSDLSENGQAGIILSFLQAGLLTQEEARGHAMAYLGGNE